MVLLVRSCRVTYVSLYICIARCYRCVGMCRYVGVDVCGVCRGVWYTFSTSSFRYFSPSFKPYGYSSGLDQSRTKKQSD